MAGALCSTAVAPCFLSVKVCCFLCAEDGPPPLTGLFCPLVSVGVTDVNCIRASNQCQDALCELTQLGVACQACAGRQREGDALKL